MQLSTLPGANNITFAPCLFFFPLNLSQIQPQAPHQSSNLSSCSDASFYLWDKLSPRVSGLVPSTYTTQLSSQNPFLLLFWEFFISLLYWIPCFLNPLSSYWTLYYCLIWLILSFWCSISSKIEPSGKGWIWDKTIEVSHFCRCLWFTLTPERWFWCQKLFPFRIWEHCCIAFYLQYF